MFARSLAAFSRRAPAPLPIDHVIYKDDRAFLIVNATPEHAEDILDSFRRQSEARFTMKRQPD